jgi:hypothetical protein
MQSHVEHDIDAAVLINYLNSGYHLFHEGAADVESMVDAMQKDLNRQCCTAQDSNRIFSNVHQALGLHYQLQDFSNVSKLLTCASCGVRQFVRDEVHYHRVALDHFACLKC